MGTEKENGQYERCVSCGKLTEVRIDLPISERRFYIEGAGQLCRECYYELYAGENR